MQASSQRQNKLYFNKLSRKQRIRQTTIRLVHALKKEGKTHRQTASFLNKSRVETLSKRGKWNESRVGYVFQINRLELKRKLSPEGFKLVEELEKQFG